MTYPFSVSFLSTVAGVGVVAESEPGAVEFLQGLEEVGDVGPRLLRIFPVHIEFRLAEVVVIHPGLDVHIGVVDGLGELDAEGVVVVVVSIGLPASRVVVFFGRFDDSLSAEGVVDSVQPLDHHGLYHREQHVIREGGLEVLLGLLFVFGLHLDHLVHQGLDVDFVVLVLVHESAELVVITDTVFVFIDQILSGAVSLEVPDKDLVTEAGDQTSAPVVGDLGVRAALDVEVDGITPVLGPVDLVVQDDDVVSVQDRVVGSVVLIVPGRSQGGREILNRVVDSLFVQNLLQAGDDLVVANAEATAVPARVSVLIGMTVDVKFHIRLQVVVFCLEII